MPISQFQWTLNAPRLIKVVPVNYFSPDELQKTLISIIRDQHGLTMTRHQFTGIAFDLFEDISGLEGVDPEQAMEIINTLWSVYCEWHSPKPVDTFYSAV